MEQELTGRYEPARGNESMSEHPGDRAAADGTGASLLAETHRWAVSVVPRARMPVSDPAASNAVRSPDPYFGLTHHLTRIRLPSRCGKPRPVRGLPAGTTRASPVRRSMHPRERGGHRSWSERAAASRAGFPPRRSPRFVTTDVPVEELKAAGAPAPRTAGHRPGTAAPGSFEEITATARR